MANKNENTTGSQKTVVNIFSNISVPVKALAAVAGIAGVTLGTGYAKDQLSEPPIQRVENVQIADAETKNALSEILGAINEVKGVVIENKTKIKAIEDNQKRQQKRIDKNETDLEEIEDRIISDIEFKDSARLII